MAQKRFSKKKVKNRTSQSASNCDFSEFLSLVTFNSLELTKEKTAYFREIFLQLDNKIEYLKLCPKYSGEITIENVFDRLKDKQAYMKHYVNSEQLIASEEIEFISGHFYEIEESKIKSLSKNVIEQIIKNKKLKLLDEDMLLRIIIDLYSEDKKVSSLFDYVYFVNVSNDEMSHFYNIFDINDMSNEVWRSLIERSLNSTVNFQSLKNDVRYLIKAFSFSEEKKFNGIIKYLTDKTGGNIHDNNTIEVTSNSFSSHPKNLLDFNSNNYYGAGHEWKDIWICYDFKEKKVKLTNYSINSIRGNSSHHLKSWVIEVSNDNSHWKQIDHQEDCQKLNGTDLKSTFAVQSNDFSRYVRLKNIAEPYGGNQLWFHSIDFYGYLIE